MLKRKYIAPEMEIDLFEDRASLVMAGSGDGMQDPGIGGDDGPTIFSEASMFLDVVMGPFDEAFSGGETVEEMPVEDPQVSFVPELAADPTAEPVPDPTAAPEAPAPAIDPVIEIDVITDLFTE